MKDVMNKKTHMHTRNIENSSTIARYREVKRKKKRKRTYQNEGKKQTSYGTQRTKAGKKTKRNPET